MRLEVVPGARIGPVELGMTRERVRAAIEEAPVTFSKGASDVDAFHSNSLQVFYSECVDEVEFIEVSRGLGLEPVVLGESVFDVPATTLVARISELTGASVTATENDTSYVFAALGLSLWRSTTPEDEQDTEGLYFDTVGVGLPAYFEAAARRLANRHFNLTNQGA